MNLQGEGGINWTDATWNPVTGCLHGCPYCYARRLSHRLGRNFAPALHPERLAEPARERQPRRVFVCSMADLFGAWVPREWIESVLAACAKAPQHTYQFLTKNPQRLAEFNPWPANAWVGGTVDVHARLAPTLAALRAVRASVRFISFEPLNEDMGAPDFLGAVEWLIIGAQTGVGAHQPDPDWVEALVCAADVARVPVLFKDNLAWPWRREEFPKHRPAPASILARPLAQGSLPL